MPQARHSDPAWSAFWRIDPRPDGRRAQGGPFIDAIGDKFEADDRSRLVAAFRKYAQAHLIGLEPAEQR